MPRGAPPGAPGPLRNSPEWRIWAHPRPGAYGGRRLGFFRQTADLFQPPRLLIAASAILQLKHQRQDGYRVGCRVARASEKDSVIGCKYMARKEPPPEPARKRLRQVIHACAVTPSNVADTGMPPSLEKIKTGRKFRRTAAARRQGIRLGSEPQGRLGHRHAPNIEQSGENRGNRRNAGKRFRRRAITGCSAGTGKRGPGEARRAASGNVERARAEPESGAPPRRKPGPRTGKKRRQTGDFLNAF